MTICAKGDLKMAISTNRKPAIYRNLYFVVMLVVATSVCLWALYLYESSADTVAADVFIWCHRATPEKMQRRER